MRRRDFLWRAAVGAARAGWERAAGQTRASTARAAKLERIAISTQSLHNYFRSTRDADFALPGPMLALLDFPEAMADKYNVRHLEICTSHFASTEPAYLLEIKYQLIHTRSTIVNLAVDIREMGREETLSNPDRGKRAAAVERAKKWINVASTLGVRSVRCDPGDVDAESLARTAESYRVLAAYALAKGVHVLVENQEGFGAGHPEEMVRLFKLVGPGRIGALPNFSNFPDEPTREKGLKLLFPYAQSLCHVDGLGFASGETPAGFDFPKAMELAKSVGFRGVYVIDFAGPGDPYTGIQKILDQLLLRL